MKLLDHVANSAYLPLVSIIGGSVMALVVMLLAGGLVRLLERMFS